MKWSNVRVKVYMTMSTHVDSSGSEGSSSSETGLGPERVPSGLILVVVMDVFPFERGELISCRSAAISRSVLCVGAARDGCENEISSLFSFA